MKKQSSQDVNISDTKSFPLRFILFFLFSALLIITIGYFYYLDQKNKIEDEYSEHISTLKEFKLQQIEAEGEVRKKILDSFINIPQAIQRRKSSSDKIILGEIKKNIIGHLENLNNKFNFLSINVFEKDNNLFYTSTTSKNILDVFLKEEIAAVLRNVSLPMKNIYLNKDKKLVQAIILPITIQSDIVGYIWAEVSFLDYLSPVIAHSKLNSGVAEFLLVKKESDLAFSMKDAADENESVINIIPMKKNDREVVQSLLNETGIFKGVEFKGRKIIGSIKNISKTKWYIIAIIDEATVSKSIRQVANVTLLFVLILVLLAMVVTYAVWNRTRLQFLIRNLQLEREKASITERYTSLTRYANDIILSMDTEGKILEVNQKATELYRMKIDNLIGKNFNELNSDNEGSSQKLKELLSVNEGIVFDSLHKKSDGSVFPVQISASRIQKHGEDIILAIIRDFSERKRLENELVLAKDKAEEMNRLKTYFLANMSHELRTPINGIMGYSEILMLELEKDKHAEMIEMGQQIYQSSARLNSTLNSLFDLARLESREMKLKNEKLDLNQIIKITANIFKTQILQKKLELKFEFENPSLQINSDENILLKIIQNLFDNSVKYTTSGSISIKTNVEDDSAKIKIIDTGIGISKEKIDIIFEPFRQGSEGLNRDYEGTGIGLSITKRFIELLGGTISIESELEKGTEVVLVFPRKK